MDGSYPIDSLVADIIEALAKPRSNLVVLAPPGCGKTTRVPPAIRKAMARGQLLEGGILVVEPRRLAAIAAAKRVAQLEAWTCGQELGWWVRLDSKRSQNTNMLFITTGILLNILAKNPLMEGIRYVIFDEFHERSLEMDLGLAMLRYLQRELEAPLQIIVMSASLLHEPIVDYLQPCECLESKSTLFPLEIRHRNCSLTTKPHTLPECVHDAVSDAVTSYEGDVLVFLPGVYEIQRARALALDSWAERYDIKTLHASLPLSEQTAVLKPNTSKRRIIYSTNVAESSITIEGIRVVIDSGLQKLKVFDPQSGLEQLQTQRISRHSATQRAGRAARLAPGLCIRLWPQVEQHLLAPESKAEVLRLELSQALLQILHWGLSHADHLEWLENPPLAGWNAAKGLLQMLGAIHCDELTPIGRRMSQLALHPRLARWMLAAQELNCIDDAALLAAYLSEAPYRRQSREAFYSPNIIDDLRELRSYIKMPQGRTVARVYVELRAKFKRGQRQNTEPTPDALARSLLSAYPDRIAMQRPKAHNPNEPVDPDADRRTVRALMVGNKGIVIKQAHSLQNVRFFVALDIDLLSGVERAESSVYKAFPIEQNLLDFQKQIRVRYEADKDRVIACEAMAYDIFTLYEKHLHDSCYDAALDEEIARAAANDLENAIDWKNPKVQSFVARVRFVSLYEGHWLFPELGIDHMRPFLPHIVKGKRSFAQIRETSLLPYLNSCLSYEQKSCLERCAPERFRFPNGRSVLIDYLAQPPIIKAKIQDFFGLHELPRLCNCKAATILHLCAPNGRVEQVTQDLASFWQNTYPELRKLLRARYPKHDWPLKP
ncbi:MAG: ATP-dependent helicase HrpB [Bradymonadales bacterium]|jgi:ATP-dependent helicase HrpB